MSDIGHNMPPPFEACSMDIEGLYEEAKNWLDGKPIATKAQADELGKLLDMLRQSRKAADELRAIEKRPHDEAAKAVQAKWKPLLDKADLATATAKKALVPYLEKVEAEQRAAAAALAEEAARKRREAEEAAAKVRADDLEAQAALEAQRKEAANAERAASKADKAKANVAGGARAIGLRSYFHPVITDRREALMHYIKRQPDALEAWLVEQATRDVNAGARSIPGFDIKEERTAA
jgi:hypothetical protein